MCWGDKGEEAAAQEEIIHCRWRGVIFDRATQSLCVFFFLFLFETKMCVAALPRVKHLK